MKLTKRLGQRVIILLVVGCLLIGLFSGCSEKVKFDPLQTQKFTDDFSDNQADGWELVGDVAECVVANQELLVKGLDAQLLATNTNFTDFLYELDLARQSGSVLAKALDKAKVPEVFGGLLFRHIKVADKVNGYSVKVVVRRGVCSLVLAKVIQGREVGLERVALETLTNACRIKVKAVANQIVVYVNHKEQLKYTDEKALLTGGKIGVLVGNGHYAFDNIKVERLAKD